MDPKDNTKAYELYKDLILKDGRFGVAVEHFKTVDGHEYIVDTDTLDGKKWTTIYVTQDDIVGYTQEQLEEDKTLKNP